MRRLLRIIAAVIAASAILFWAAAGGNRGWTKTSVPRKTLDDVTGIEGIAFEKKFVPGVDFLGAVVAGALALAGASFLFRNRVHKPEI